MTPAGASTRLCDIQNNKWYEITHNTLLVTADGMMHEYVYYVIDRHSSPREKWLVIVVLFLYKEKYERVRWENVKTFTVGGIRLQRPNLFVLFLTFSVLVANPKKLLYTVVNPARGLLNRGKEKGSLAAHHPLPPTLLVTIRGKSHYYKH